MILEEVEELVHPYKGSTLTSVYLVHKYTLNVVSVLVSRAGLVVLSIEVLACNT